MSPLILSQTVGLHSRRGTHQLVDLGEGWVLDVQAVCGDQVQGRVVQHHLEGIASR